MTQRHNSRLTRREALKLGLTGAAGLSLANPRNILARPAMKPGKAKSIIQIWMWGGPTHLDTFDPKPDAGYDYCGKFKSPLSTSVDGMRVCELLPLMAKQADKYTVINSMTHGINSHETASYISQTGRKAGRLVYPSVGAVVSRFKGIESGYKGAVPPYIVLTKPQGRFSEAGFLGPGYKPFSTGGDPNQSRFVVEGVIAQGITDQRQRDRRKLLNSLDSLGKAMPDNQHFEDLDHCKDDAYDLMFGEARNLFDLGKEDEKLRDRYGRNTFGQSCLQARRLVESGVPYVTINYNGWDTHKQNFEIMDRKLPELDAGMATLLEDLSDRGLLDSTVVWWCGEFGRGPKIQWNAPWNGGRSHYGKCYSAVIAGGGFKGGHVIGSSDDKGMEVVERAVYPTDVISSIYEQMGIDPNGPLPNSRNLQVTVQPSPDDEGVDSGGRLREIM